MADVQHLLQDVATPKLQISDLNIIDDSNELSKYKIKCEWDTIYYIPDFITAEEEECLVGHVNKSPKPKWTQLSNRRLQNWGGVPHPKGMLGEDLPFWLKKYTEKIGNMGLFDGKNPNHVLINEYEAGQGIMPHLDGNLFYPRITTINLGSHTVLNFYKPLESEDEASAVVRIKGDSHWISGEHSNQRTYDGSADAAITPSWADRLVFSVLLEPRSLLILQDQCYNTFLHGIDEISEDKLNSSIVNLEECSAVVGDELKRSTRISLTIRFVPKTTKSLIRLGR